MPKLLVPSGAPVHLSDGDWFWPLQPKTLASISLVPTAPFLMSSLVTFICACATGAAMRPAARTATPNPTLYIGFLPCLKKPRLARQTAVVLGRLPIGCCLMAAAARPLLN